MDYTQLGLPEDVINFVIEHGMVPFEDVALEILKLKLPSLTATTTIPERFDYPYFVLVRRVPGLGYWDGDPRFVDYGSLSVHVFARDTMEDPNGEAKAAIISEAVRIAFYQAQQESLSFPGLGTVSQLKLLEEPVRKADWATSSGPVQYADLPKNMWRYESTYQMRVKRPARR